MATPSSVRSGLRSGPVVVIDPVKLAAVLRGPQGGVAQDLLRRAENVRQEAKRLVGVHQPQPGERRGRRPGTLRDSINKRLVNAATDLGFAAEVGTDDPVGFWHHEGTQPHRILPRRAPALVFYWPKVGHVVSLPAVNHPGTRPNRFLTRALPAARR
jgi:hypothetical protein